MKPAFLLFFLALFITACENTSVSRIEQCKQLTPALLQQQLQLGKEPELEWLLAAEEEEVEVQTQAILSFRILDGGIIRLPDNGHSHVLAPDQAMNIVCRFVYQLHQQDSMSQQPMDRYETFPSDIILNNQMIDPELIKNIHNSL